MPAARARKSKQSAKDTNYTALASKVALSYRNSARSLGISAATLSAAALRGAAKGHQVFKRKGHKTIKLQPYLAWWMRREVHRVLVRKALDRARTKPEEVERVLLDLLED